MPQSQNDSGSLQNKGGAKDKCGNAKVTKTLSQKTECRNEVIYIVQPLCDYFH